MNTRRLNGDGRLRGWAVGGFGLARSRWSVGMWPDWTGWLLAVLWLWMPLDLTARDPLRKARLRWEKRKPDAYAYLLQVRCFCPEALEGPFRLVVWGDSLVSVNGRPHVAGDSQLMMTPSQLFDRARRYLDRKPATRHLAFHPTFGFIEQAFFDPRAGVMDDEFRWSITEFTVLPRRQLEYTAPGPDEKSLPNPSNPLF